MKLAFFAVIILPALVASLGAPNPKGSGHGVTGGWGKTAYDWTIGKDKEVDLQAKLAAGNVYVRLHGKGTLVLASVYWTVGDNTTIDGDDAQITIKGPKGLFVSKTKNIIITGLCFKENETAVNMSSGGQMLWVHRNTFSHSAWGSPVALSGTDCDMNTRKCKTEAKGITISNNRFENDHYGPLMFYGVGEASFYNNVWRKVITRIPRAQNQGTFHMCNNLFESWTLGFQGDDGAKLMYENNVFNRYDSWMIDTTHGNINQTLTNTWVMNPQENIQVCLKGNQIQGNQDNSGPHAMTNTGVMKFNCNFIVPYPASCPAITGTAQQFAQSIDKNAGVPWCSP